MTGVDRVRAKLESKGCKPRGGAAFCPSCEAGGGHRTPSFSISSNADGDALVRCHKNCSVGDIVEALGMTVNELFTVVKYGMNIVATYPYIDAEGTVLYEAVRLEPKSFRMRRADGEWKGPRPGEHVLYRLPQVLAGIDAGRTVLVVEGEKDADALAKAKFIATTNIGGADKWRPEYSAQLAGAARVVILPDNDDAGREHAMQVAWSLSPDIDVRVVHLPDMPEKGDASDWLRAGGTQEQLAELVEATPRFDPSIAPRPAPAPDVGNLPTGPATDEVAAGMFVDWATFWQRDRREAEWAFEDVLAKGRGHALYASHKAGKSLLMLHIAATLAADGGYVVCYLDYEMGEDDLYERLADMGYGPDDDLSRLHYALLPSLPPLDTREGAAALMQTLDGVQAEHPDQHLVVVLDTTARAVAGEENSADTIRAFYSHTGIELKRRGITWARLDHAGKDAKRGQRGSSSKGDDVDVVWRLVATEKGVQLRRDVARMSWVPEKVTFTVGSSPLSYTRVEGDWPAGTTEIAQTLDNLGVPVEASARQAATALREADQGARDVLVRAAVKYRQQTPAVVSIPRDAPRDAPPDLPAGRTSGRTSKNPHEHWPDAPPDAPGRTPSGSAARLRHPIGGRTGRASSETGMNQPQPSLDLAPAGGRDLGAAIAALDAETPEQRFQRQASMLAAQAADRPPCPACTGDGGQHRGCIA